MRWSTSHAAAYLAAAACSLGLACLLNGCVPAARQPEDSDRIRVALNWLPDSQHAGFYAADVFGDFAAQQLSVQIIPGGPAAPIVQNVALKQVEFAVANADQVLMARAQGAPVVAVLASMQTSPRCIMVHRETGILSLHELRDLTLALGAGKAFAQFLQRELPLENVKIVPYTGSVALFLEDKRYAQQAYVFSEPFVVRQHGADPSTLMVSELGFDPYTSCLITHEDLIRSDPDKVRKVVHCIRRGWLEYFRQPRPVHERILTANRQMDLASLEFGLQTLRPLVLPEGQDESVVGSMDPQRWQTLCEQLIQLELLPAGADPTAAYTTQFIEPLESLPSRPAAPTVDPATPR
jgi:NitT/TauT family transport system substrate-binding protein